MGAGGYDRWDWEEYEKSNMEQSRKEQDRKSFSPELNELLSEKLSDYNTRDTDQINKHLETIIKALENEIEGTLKLLFGGSVTKFTYVNGLSDVDMLVILNKSDLAKKAPKEVLDYFKRRLEERLPESEISMGDLAVTVRFKSSNIEIQLLPGIRTKTGVKIIESELNRWSNVIKPRKFAEKLTEINQQNNNKVVPIIKLFKPINNKFPKDIRMSGYHIEALAIRIFENYEGKKTYSEMLRHFCNEAKSKVLHPIEEITGQSEYIDKKFGQRNSESRKKVSSHLQRLINKMDIATSSKSIGDWEDILE